MNRIVKLSQSECEQLFWLLGGFMWNPTIVLTEQQRELLKKVRKQVNP